jgi:5-methyltetrahydrofolate--homocysteine methyltransferase
MDLYNQVSEKLQQGEDEAVAKLVRECIDKSLPAGEILDRGLIHGMNVVGEKFRSHEIFLPEVLLAARAMYAGMDLLRPLLETAGVQTKGRIVIGTVQGDLHDIGKNLVGIMLRGAGYEVIDLGNDVSPERFVEEAKKAGAKLIGMSALLTTTMPAMKKVTERLKEQGLDQQIRTIIGGAPVTEDFAREIGADAYGYDAANAVVEVQSLIR